MPRQVEYHSRLTGMTWVLKHPRATIQMLGYIPGFLRVADPRPAAEQIATAYIGGWSPFKGFTMLPDGNLAYPGDPPTRLLAESRLRHETIRFYEHSWLAIVQPNGEFEVARLD